MTDLKGATASKSGLLRTLKYLYERRCEDQNIQIQFDQSFLVNLLLDNSSFSGVQHVLEYLSETRCDDHK